MKHEHHHLGIQARGWLVIVSTPNSTPRSRNGRIEAGQSPRSHASSASAANADVDSLNGCRKLASDQPEASCRQRGQVLSQRSHRHHNWCRSVRCNSSSGRPKAACWRRVPPDLRCKYGYHHTIVLHFVRRLDFETRLAKGAPFGIPDFGDHDQDIIDHDPSGHWSWIAAADSANMRPDDERSLHECAKDRERRAIRTRSRPDCCRIDFDLISDHSAFVVDLFPINYLLNRQSI